MTIKRAKINGDQITSFQRGNWQKFRTGELETANGEHIRVTIDRAENGSLSFNLRHEGFAWFNRAFEYAQTQWGAKSESEAARMYWDALDFAEFGCVSSAK